MDDHPVLRQGLKQILDLQPNLRVCCEAETGPEALELIVREAPDLVLIDLSLRGGDGIDLVKDIKALRPQTRMLVLSMHDEFIYAERVLRAGAQGYVMKHEKIEHLLAAIAKVLDGGVYVSDKVAARLIQRVASSGSRADAVGSTVDRLTDRELQVFRLIGEGLGTRLIAEKLGVSRKTVESHREHIKEKLMLTSGEELIQRAVQWARNPGDRKK